MIGYGKLLAGALTAEIAARGIDAGAMTAKDLAGLISEDSAATLRNISARGLQVEGDELPPRDTFVSLFIDGLIVPGGEVVWRKGNLAGIELMEELRWSSLMPWVREVGRREV